MTVFVPCSTVAPSPVGVVQALLQRYGWNTMACQIQSPAFVHWFAPEGEAVVGYVVAGRTWVVAGAPVCPPEQLAATALAFEAVAEQQGRRVCYFGAQRRLVEALAGQGPRACLRLGAQPVWDPHGWPNILAHKASLRAQLARARNKGVTVTALTTQASVPQPELARCLSEWLATRGLPPLHFLVEPATLRAADDHRVFVARRNTLVLAYLVATPIPQRNGWLIEQIVRGQAAPNGTAELLIDAALRDLAAAGATYVTLGLAPLSPHGTDDAPRPPYLIRALLAWMQAHGRRFYNFAGLDAFKAKLQPDAWESVYALSKERRPSFRTLYAIVAAFGGAPPPRFLSRALVRAVAQEVHWLSGRF